MRLRHPQAQGQGTKGLSIEERLKRAIAEQGAVHLTLIDPAKQSPGLAAQIASDAEAAGSSALMVGGSTQAGGKLLDRTLLAVKRASNLPVILFPSSERGISRHADAIFFMSMLNSRDPYFISGAQRRGAPLVKRFGLEPIPMAYLVVEPGEAVGRVGKAKLIPRRNPKLAADFALAAQYMGMRFIYLEAGSGARAPVPVNMVKAVRRATDLTLVVGGGIRSPRAAAARVRAGAQLVVTGTLVEESEQRIKQISEIVRAITKSSCA